MDRVSIAREVAEAIEAEKLAAAERLAGLGALEPVPLRDGRRAVAEPGATIYTFACELELALPEDTDVRLDAPGVSATGSVLEHDPDQGLLRLVLRQNVGARLDEARLFFDASFLLDKLAARVTEICEEEPAEGEAWNLELALDLLLGRDRPGEPVASTREGPSPAQAAAIGRALAQRVSYLWGPPGTGKTRTVAYLVHELVERGERVLLSAHTNTATDHALLTLLGVDRLGDEDVVRVGYCSEKVLQAGVDLDSVIDRVARRDRELVDDVARVTARLADGLERVPRDLVSSRTPLGRRLRMARDLFRQLSSEDEELRDPIAMLLERLEALELGVVREARVVATTLTQLFISRVLEPYRADALVLDEASMASLAHSLVAASMARRRVVAVGDFMQLPAVVLSEQQPVRRWLGNHVFSSARCDDPASEHALRELLHEQWRMHPRISRLVSELFYAGRLRDADAVREAAHPHPAIALVDTSRSASRATSTPRSSKRNEWHARFVAELVCRAPATEMAVIAPYRAQVRRIRDLIRDQAPERLARGEVEVFTVHRFQGRDKRLVIFDLVDAPGAASGFLDELRNPHVACLLNVAMSRAMRGLVLVAHLDHLAGTLGRRSVVGRLLETVRLHGEPELEADHPGDRQQLEAFLTRIA